MENTGSSRFFDEVEDDVDDYTFLKHSKQGPGGYMFDRHLENGPSHQQQRADLLQDEIDRLNQRSVESSFRCLTLVNESEKIGISTAEELSHQREQLENCEGNVAEINRSLRITQKHINSIKSVFGGFMNKFSRGSDASSTVPVSSSKKTLPDNKSLSKDGGDMHKVLHNNVKSQSVCDQQHPALKLRGVEYGSQSEPEISHQTKMTTGPLFAPQAEQQLDNNLDDLVHGLDRLKGLAMGLGDEIEEQNALLDRLNTSLDRASVGMERQNAQMKKILKK